nr:Gfo/Idh/MocA family oxidoreductase [Maliibacterium massiliense]
MAKKLRVAMIGYAFMGRAHANALARLPMFFDVGAEVERAVLCGQREEPLKAAAARLGFAQIETDWRRAVARRDIDVVHICTPAFLHYDMAMACAQAGKHMLLEKPMCFTLAQARAMAEAAGDAGVVAQLGFNYRYVPAVLLARQMLQEGALGRIYHFRGVYAQDWGNDGGQGMSWRYRKQCAGSGALGDIGSHVSDLARYLVGEVDSVAAQQRTFVAARQGERVDVDDACGYLAQFACGAMGSVEATRFAPGEKNALRFEINGEKGSLRFDLQRFNELGYYNAEDPQALAGWRTIQVNDACHPYGGCWWPVGHALGYEHTFVHEMAHFYKAIAQGGEAMPDFTEGARTTALLEAVARAAATRAWTDVERV